MRELVIGLGASSGVGVGAVLELLCGLPCVPGEVIGFATIDIKTTEPGLINGVREWAGAGLTGYPAEVLAAVEVPTPSEFVRARVGTASVAEAAALIFARAVGPAELIVTKRKGRDVTAAVARLL